VAQYSGTEASDAKHHEELGAENAWLKKWSPVSQALDIDMLKEISGRNF
jgi:hypothetical protein